jgi:hypothetical protein
MNMHARSPSRYSDVIRAARSPHAGGGYLGAAKIRFKGAKEKFWHSPIERQRDKARLATWLS